MQRPEGCSKGHHRNGGLPKDILCCIGPLKGQQKRKYPGWEGCRMGQACFYHHKGWQKDGMMRALGLREAKVRRIEAEAAAILEAHEARMQEGGLAPPQFELEAEGMPPQELAGAPQEGGQPEGWNAEFSPPTSPGPEDTYPREEEGEEEEDGGARALAREDAELCAGVPEDGAEPDVEMVAAAPVRCVIKHRNKKPPEPWESQERERRRKRRRLVELRDPPPRGT